MAEEKTNIFQREISLGKTFKDKSKEEFYKEFASLMDSGIDIQRTMQILIEEQKSKRKRAAKG